MKYIIAFFILTLLSVSASYAQNGKRSGKKKNGQEMSPSTTDPGSFNENKIFGGSSTSKKKAKHSSSLPTQKQKMDEYEDRMEANAKKYKEAEKEMSKPRYNDPEYFGHKHKPKKRAPGKKKFCKECGMVH
jgi:hypothetical protein